MTFPCRLDTTDPGYRMMPRVCLTRPKIPQICGIFREPEYLLPRAAWCAQDAAGSGNSLRVVYAARRPGSDGPAETPEERVVVKGRSGTGFSFRDHHAG